LEREEGGVDIDGLAFGLVSASGEDGFGDLGEIERLPLFDPAFAGGQGEEGLDESLLVFT